MSERGLNKTLAWLRGLSMPPVSERWVPGASEGERRALAGLASIAAHLSGGVQATWPGEIQDWLQHAVPLPEEVANEVETATEKRPDEALASLYAHLVAGRNRRVLGTFFTPSDEVSLMLERWAATEDAPTKVIDVGAGVGVFTAAAADQWPAASVTAVDINPITLGLLAARMQLPDAGVSQGRLELVLADFTRWLPDQTEAQTGGRLILGNPPYTRWQLIPPEMRSRLAEETADLCGRRASLSAYITAVSLQHLHRQDGLCLLLPAQWLESDYARGLRQRLLAMRHRRVELWLVKSAMFEDATVDAVVLLVGTKKEVPQAFTVAEWHGGTPVEIERLHPSDGEWRNWFEASPSPAQAQRFRLGNIATVRRGVATGANRFFVLSDQDVRKLGLPMTCLRPLVQRLLYYRKGVDQASFNALADCEPKWLFTTKPRKNLAAAISRYIEYGESEGYSARHLCSARRVWFDLEHDLQIPDVIITAMSRDVFHVVTNDLGAAVTNNLYGWRWSESTPDSVRSNVVSWLQSADGQQALRRSARRQGNNLLKLEPRALSELALPESLFEGGSDSRGTTIE